MKEIILQVIDLVKLFVYAITIIYIIRFVYSHRAKKFCLKFKEVFTIITEYYDD